MEHIHDRLLVFLEECGLSQNGLAGFQGSVTPKFGFGIGNRIQGPISVSVFLPKPTLFFQIFLIFSHFFLEYKFISFKINQILKNDLKVSNFQRKFGFKGPFMMEKQYLMLSVTRFSLLNVVLVLVTVSAKSICQCVLGFWYQT